MISYPKSYDKTSLGLFRCAICRNEIEDYTNVYPAGLNFGLVCDDCYKSFPEEDIELMLNMFIAYGGYFGKKQGSIFSLKILLKDLVDEITIEKENINVKELNIKMLHKALLYGIAPKEFLIHLEKLSC
jgi:hypothetical protein